MDDIQAYERAAEKTGGEGQLSPAGFTSGYFDFNFHPRVGKTRRDHGGCRTDITEIAAQHRPAWFEILNPRQDIANPDDIGDDAAGARERLLDIEHALFRLLHYVVGNRHRFVVESGSAGNEHPLAVHDGARVADFGFKSRTR